jgi:hypothetical protein
MVRNLLIAHIYMNKLEKFFSPLSTTTTSSLVCAMRASVRHWQTDLIFIMCLNKGQTCEKGAVVLDNDVAERVKIAILWRWAFYRSTEVSL